jgi:hypothetical protein
VRLAEVLLVGQAGIDSDEHVHLAAGQLQQRAVPRAGPSALGDCRHIVVWAKGVLESTRKALVQKDAHASAEDRCGGQLEHANRLLAMDCREVFQELVQTLPGLEVGREWQTSPRCSSCMIPIRLRP